MARPLACPHRIGAEQAVGVGEDVVEAGRPETALDGKGGGRHGRWRALQLPRVPLKAVAAKKKKSGKT